MLWGGRPLLNRVVKELRPEKEHKAGTEEEEEGSKQGVSRGVPGAETCLCAPGKHQDPNKELTKADDLAAATFLSAD